MENDQINYSEEFALSAGGPLYNAMVKMRFFNTQKKLAFIALLIAWLPLVIISAIEGTLFNGVQIPFMMDIPMQARILVALPMLIIIKKTIDLKVIDVAKYIVNALMDTDEREMILHTAFHRAKKLTSSTLTEITILLVVIVATVSFVRAGIYGGLESGITSWMVSYTDGQQALSLAGYWSVCVSIPVFQFFLFRWLWRYFVWILLLFRLSKAELKLIPTHADKSGGLGIIIMAQRSFNLFFVTNSVVISGELIARLLKHPDDFFLVRSEVFGYIAICLVLLILPLIFFTGMLMKTKNEGIMHLSNLSAKLSNKFEKEWATDKPIDLILKEQQIDPSLVFDFTGMFEVLQKLKPVPITIRDIIGMGLTLFVPFIPLLFIHFSVTELLQKIIGILL